ncbi:hypothetical protein GGR54DRAFT_635095 [Hypoxylon sp. NC1633]|nr:hypothetical protein GGR54DRAFT_635095 [Hypoxylon sp. NC1633]
MDPDAGSSLEWDISLVVSPDVLEAAEILEAMRVSRPSSQKETTTLDTESVGSRSHNQPVRLALTGNGDQLDETVNLESHDPSTKSQPPSRYITGEPPRTRQATRAYVLSQAEASSLRAPTDIMPPKIDPNQVARHNSRLRPGTDNSVMRLIQQIDAVVGGSPPENASREDDDRYVNKWMEEKHRRDVEDDEKTWTQLARAEQFIKRMAQQPFHFVGSSDEEGRSTMANQRKDRAERRSNLSKKTRTVANRGNVKSRKTRQEAEQVEVDNQSSTLAKSLVATTDIPRPSPADGTEVLPPAILPLNTVDIPESQVGPRPKKKRRTAAENLESDLGRGWEPHVDAEGHRPARRGVYPPGPPPGFRLPPGFSISGDLAIWPPLTPDINSKLHLSPDINSKPYLNHEDDSKLKLNHADRSQSNKDLAPHNEDAKDYYSLRGYGQLADHMDCISLKGGHVPLASDTGNSCEFFPNGGNSPGKACSEGTFFTPTSFVIRDGYCVVYDEYNCEGYSSKFFTPLYNGCVNVKDAISPPKNWASMKCYAQ